MKVYPIFSNNISYKAAPQSGKYFTATSNLNFTSDYVSLTPKNTSEDKDIIKSRLSEIYRIDREHVYLGETDDETKFSKAGYYLSLKKDSSINNINPRVLNNAYNDLYNIALKSLYSVANNEQKYSEISLKSNPAIKLWQEYFNTNDIGALNAKIREEYSRNNNLDSLVIHTIDNLLNPVTPKMSDVANFTLNENILLSSADNIEKFFDSVNSLLSYTDKDTFNKIYQNLDAVSEGVYTNNDKLLNKGVNELKAILSQQTNNEVSEKTDINDFINSSEYKTLNRSINMDLLFKNKTLDDNAKLFLIKKVNSENGLDLLSFLITNPANNKIRVQIINNLINSEKMADENFGEIKMIFLDDINQNNPNSKVINNEINNEKLIDLVISQTPKKSNIHLMSDKDKIVYLAQFPEEEVVSMLENLRNDWIDYKYDCAFEMESSKYDLNKRADDIIDNITITIDGKKKNIVDVVNESFSILSGQNIDITKANAEILEQVLSGNDLLAKHDEDSYLRDRYACDQMLKITEKLYENSEESKKIHADISKALDILEILNPQNKKQIQDTRSTLQKLKDGIFKADNIVPATGVGIAVAKVAQGLIATGEPHSATAGAILMLLLYGERFVRNIAKEFRND